MKNFIKRPAFLVLMVFSLVFISCESNEDTLIEEQKTEAQGKELSLEFGDNYTYASVNLPDGRSSNRYPARIVRLKANGKYLSSENGNKAMTCNRVYPGSWEEFDMFKYPDANGSEYILRGNNGRYVQTRGARKRVYCDRLYANEATVFTLAPKNGLVALSRYGGAYRRYLNSENGSKPVTWKNITPGSTQLWRIEE